MRVNNINTTINFQAGFTKQLKTEALSCNINKISKEFAKQGIPTDFKNNRIAAWCSVKCFEIIQYLNKTYNLNLGLPKGIYVEDFSKLRVADKEADAFCNLAPTNLYLDNDKIMPENAIYINQYKEADYRGGNNFWENIDFLANSDFANKYTPTDSFLYIFMHEFSHVIHNTNMINKLGGENYLKTVLKTFEPDFLQEFPQKYGEILSHLNYYATTHPLDTIACDLAKRLTDGINTSHFIPQNNLLENTPYLRKKPFAKEDVFDQTIRRFFNGNFK